jgi:hypothetical protein
MRLPQRHREALRESGNVIGLSVAAALSAATLNPLPLLVGLVVEAAYLLFVPDTKWYYSRLARRHDAEIERAREEAKAAILPQLSAEVREHFVRLERVRAEIALHPPDSRLLTADHGWFREVLRKLDYLLDKFLQFAQKDVQFRDHLRSVLDEVRADGRAAALRHTRDGVPWIADPRESKKKPQGARGDADRASGRQASSPPGPAEGEHLEPTLRWVVQSAREIEEHYESDLEGIRAQLGGSPDPSTRAVLEKRADVIERRKEFITKLERILTNLTQQLRLVEDTFGLINDEIRARPPEQVLAEIDDVVMRTQTMTEVLDELAPMGQMITRLAEETPAGPRDER